MRRKTELKRYQVQLTNNYSYKTDGWKGSMIKRFDTLEECEKYILEKSIPNMHIRIKDNEAKKFLKEVHTEINENSFGF